MSRLLRERYLPCEDGQAWDLATGERVPLDQRDDALPPSTPHLRELLDHGREGEPRSVLVEARSGADARSLVRRIAADATARGFIPIAAEMYWRLREVLHDELAERTLLLIARRTAVPDAWATLVDAAARCPRPHLLLTIRVSAGADANVVREARAAYAGRPVGVPPRRMPIPADIADHLKRAARAEQFVAGGRHAAAERLLREVGASLDRRGAVLPAASVRVALGRLLLDRGRAAAADAVFEEVAARVDRRYGAAAIAEARLWQAAARTDLGQLSAAEAIARALMTIEAPEGVRIRATAALARVMIWQDRVDDAAGLVLARPDDDDEAAAYVDAVRVRVLIRAGRLFDAGTIARDLAARAASTSIPLVRVLAATTQLRIAVETGDAVFAEERLSAALTAARAARAPLRAARARLLWVDLLHRAGRTAEARRALIPLTRLGAAAPPLLRSAIDRRVRGTAAGASSIVVPLERPRSDAAATLVHLAYEQDDDRTAIAALFEWIAARLQASRVDLVSNDAGPATVVISVGAGVPTRLGARVLESGLTIGPEPADPGRELGVPVRLGSRLVGAIALRWPVDRAHPAGTLDLAALAAAVAAPRVEALIAAAREVAQASTAVPELVGVSAGIDQVRRAAARAALSPFAVLIEGESGVGKELVARAVHQLSPRRDRRFCDLNCAALPDDLFESELFGHSRGAFTGAVAERAGLFEEADGGTLFLDELADLSPRAQAKLLRVIQQHEVRRIGEGFSRPVDVRIVAAVNRDMQAEVREGRFRQDLLYRVDVVRIRIPPLRERPEDIPVLAAHFWRAAAGRVGTRASLTHGVLAALSRYPWPGNVRELQNVMAALAVAAPAHGRIRPSLLPPAIAGTPTAGSPRLADARAAFERRFIQMALARAAGSRTRAARDLGVSRQGLLKLMARLGIGGDGAECGGGGDGAESGGDRP
jgi:DNA-binding NtrC family response regulator